MIWKKLVKIFPYIPLRTKKFRSNIRVLTEILRYKKMMVKQAVEVALNKLLLTNSPEYD